MHQSAQMEWLWSAAFWLKAPDLSGCVPLGCKCIVSPTAVRLLSGEGAKGIDLKAFSCRSPNPS